jgi:hypothetical protein
MKLTGTITLTVSNITLTGFAYDPTKNTPSTVSIAVP